MNKRKKSWQGGEKTISAQQKHFSRCKRPETERRNREAPKHLFITISRLGTLQCMDLTDNSLEHLAGRKLTLL